MTSLIYKSGIYVNNNYNNEHSISRYKARLFKVKKKIMIKV